MEMLKIHNNPPRREWPALTARCTQQEGEITERVAAILSQVRTGGDKALRRILPFRMTDQSEADRFAKGLLRDANKNATVGTLWTGSLLRDYAAGSVVTLATEGVKSWDGTAFISRIRHDYVKTRSKLYLRKPLEGY